MVRYNSQLGVVPLRKAPCLFPDPLLCEDMISISAKETRPLWITVKVPGDALPGIYKGEINVLTENGDFKFPLRLKVYPFDIPTESNFQMGAWAGEAMMAQELCIIDSSDDWSMESKKYSPPPIFLLYERCP